MKTFFRVSMLGLLMVALTAFTSVAVMAQDDEQKEKTELYNCFVDNYDKYTIPQQEKALDCAKKYIAKFPTDKQYVDYFNGAIPDIEKWIKDKKEADAKAAQAEADRKARAARIKRFNEAYKAAVANVNDNTWQEVFAATEDLINNDKDLALDAKILLASSGSSYLAGGKTPIDTFNNKIISNAESAITGINAAPATKKTFGVFDAKFDSREKALAEMNEVIGFIKLERQKKEDGVAQYYKSLQYEKDWQVYRKIGAWYLSKAAEIGKIRTALDQKDEANLPKIKEYLAMERGYASRAIDAYARAYSLARADTKLPAEGKQALFNRLKQLFEFRFTQPREVPMKSEASINSYVATVNTKEMPDPTSEVKPIALEEPKPVEDGKTDTKSEMKEDAKTSTKNGTTRSRTVSKTSPPKK